MAVQVQQPGRLLDVWEQDGQLVVVRKSAAFRGRYIWGTAAVAVLLLLLVGYLWSFRMVTPFYLVFAVIAMVVLLAVADRAYNMGLFARRDDTVVLDKENDRILRNGAEFAPLSKAQQVLVRYVRERDEGEGYDDCVLLLVFEDRKLKIAEGLGLPNSIEEIRAAAEALARYAGLTVEEATRMASEWWMDA